jgi:archaellin
MTGSPTRRTVLGSLSAIAAGLSGCLRFQGDGDSSTADGDAAGSGTTGAEDDGTPSPTQTPTERERSTENQEQTETEASQQVANRVQIVSQTGTNITDKAIGVVEIVVKLPPGGAEVDLSEVTTQWVSPSGTFNLGHPASEATGADGTFGVRAFKDESGAAPVLDDPDDRLQLVFDLGEDQADVDDAEWLEQNAFGEKLPEGASVALQLTMPSGGQTETRLVVPESLSGADAVRL